MISESMAEMLEDQMESEYAAARLYMGLASLANAESLCGFRRLFEEAASDERHHALCLQTYLEDQGQIVSLDEAKDIAIAESAEPLAWIEAAVAVEQEFYKKFDELRDAATKESDHATNDFLAKFTEEQMKSVRDLNKLLVLLRGNHDILLVDKRAKKLAKKMAERTFDRR